MVTILIFHNFVIDPLSCGMWIIVPFGTMLVASLRCVIFFDCSHAW